MAALAGYNAAVYIATNASSVSLPADDVLTDSGDHTTYTENTASHRYWDDSAAPVVQIDTVGDGAHYNTVAANTYTVQYVGGKIIFNSANSSATLVRIHSGGKYFAYTTFAQGTNWELDGTADMADVSIHGGGRAKQYLPLLLTGKFTLKAFWIDNTFLGNITSGFRLIFSGSVNGTKRHEAYSYTTDEKLAAVVNSTVNDDLSFQVTGAWYYN